MGNVPVTAMASPPPPSDISHLILPSHQRITISSFNLSSVHLIVLAVSEEYDEYDEDQMLERAIDMGLNFEQALALISSGYGLSAPRNKDFSKQDFSGLPIWFSFAYFALPRAGVGNPCVLLNYGGDSKLLSVYLLDDSSSLFFL